MPLVRKIEGAKSVRADVNGRRFTVVFDAQNNPVRITERKTYNHEGLTGFYTAVYWNAKHHALGMGNTLPKRIIAAARENDASS